MTQEEKLKKALDIVRAAYTKVIDDMAEMPVIECVQKHSAIYDSVDAEVEALIEEDLVPDLIIEVRGGQVVDVITFGQRVDYVVWYEDYEFDKKDNYISTSASNDSYDQILENLEKYEAENTKAE